MSCLETKIRLWLVILICLVCLWFSGAEQTAQAARVDPIVVGWSLGLEVLSTAAYYMYKNSPAERLKGYQENLGPGEWYIGGYLGLSYLASTDWNFDNNLPGATAKDINYSLGPVAGLKAGRYFDSAPWFGIEAETRFSKNNISGLGHISTPQALQPSPTISSPDWFMIWAIQLHLLARYGFLKDKEVTFGRLQPYIGIGGGVDLDFWKSNSTGNYALETLGGIRYMLNQHLGVFFEYKFAYQFATEYQDVLVYNNFPNGVRANYTCTFDQPQHMFVLGFAYHFKNLYGN
jgi:hypothetical protein